MADIIQKTYPAGRKVIVFGMPWFAVAEDESPKKAAAAFAKESLSPFDLVVFRREATPQFGVATSIEGAKAGGLSAASIVADLVTVDSWIYVLEIEGGVWICSGREGYILPDGDKVYASREAARAAFAKLTPSSFKKVYLPASWKQEGAGSIEESAEVTNLEQFLEYSAPKWGRLAPLSPFAGILKAGAALVLMGGVGVGVWFTFLAPEPAQQRPVMTPDQLAALLAQQEAEASATSDRQAEIDRIMNQRPWEDLAPAVSIYDTCLAGIRGMPSRPVGYELTALQCDGYIIDGLVQRGSGYSSWLREWADTQENLIVELSINGDTGFMTREIDHPAPRGPENLAPFSGISETLLTNGQIEGASINLATPAATPVPNEPDLVPPFAVSTYSIATLRPDVWRDFFTGTPGLALKSVHYDIAKKLYTMEGEIYVPNH